MAFTPRQIYYKLYYKENKQHIIETVLKYQSENQQAKRDYYTTYNHNYYIAHKQKKMSTPKIELHSLNGKQNKVPAIKIPKIKQKVIEPMKSKEPKVKQVPKYEHLKGDFVLFFN